MNTNNRQIIGASVFLDLAELLLEMFEEDESPGCEIPMPRSIILRTATALCEGYESGYLVPDENGNLYNIYMNEEYCGLYEKFFEGTANK